MAHIEITNTESGEKDSYARKRSRRNILQWAGVGTIVTGAAALGIVAIPDIGETARRLGIVWKLSHPPTPEALLEDMPYLYHTFQFPIEFLKKGGELHLVSDSIGLVDGQLPDPNKADNPPDFVTILSQDLHTAQLGEWVTYNHGLPGETSSMILRDQVKNPMIIEHIITTPQNVIYEMMIDGNNFRTLSDTPQHAAELQSVGNNLLQTATLDVASRFDKTEQQMALDELSILQTVKYIADEKRKRGNGELLLVVVLAPNFNDASVTHIPFVPLAGDHVPSKDIQVTGKANANIRLGAYDITFEDLSAIKTALSTFKDTDTPDFPIQAVATFSDKGNFNGDEHLNVAGHKALAKIIEEGWEVVIDGVAWNLYEYAGWQKLSL